ncbi:MAG TPA: sigma 54-interacting transcriptional regulator [Polyangiaceae bacterium]|nr:sigma 54-interacting transcriptional regulator [Polyangiaceae bacterium]
MEQRLASSVGSESDPSAPTVEIPPSSPAAAWVVEAQDEEEARRVALSAEPLVVGTSPEAGLVLNDATVSARHCALRVLGGSVAIEDLGSRNGTFVGGARIREARGQPGTVVTLGRSMLVVTTADEADAAGPPGEPLPGIAGSSIAMRRLADQIRRLARHALPVLVAGESGTGKELLARALHAEGPRRARPFVAINVTAVPRELVESELFGHERGAFTGAHVRREGAFADAEGGTLFLDEIGDLPIEAQPKILRALDGYEVRRVGGAGSGRRADVRVVAATHARLEQRVSRGDFRRDLYHRLECFVVHVPPLRERRGDIAIIARELLRQLAPDVGPHALTAAAVSRLAAHNWPGNVRELRNALCRAADGSIERSRIGAEDVDRALRRDRRELAKCMTSERARELLRDSSGNLSAAARAAGLPRTSFRKLLGA